jgi:N-acetylmuramic acid 6-phosphate etherase
VSRAPDYDALATEQSLPPDAPLDTLDELQLVDRIHAQDLRALRAVGAARGELAALVAAAAGALDGGGRLIYVGAGTSGRLAALDAAECPPTFGTRRDQVIAVVAGGPRALHRSVEGAEDSRAAGRAEMRRLVIDARDLVCGVTASGVTPFVLAALDVARRRGATTALITCAPRALVRRHAPLLVCLDVGAEAIAGSTRMKAGLATKAALHSLSTAAMIRLGKVYDDLMVDVRPISRKLQRRAERIVARLTGLSTATAARLLRRSGRSAKVAVVMHHHQVSARRARALLAAAGGRLREVVGELGR